MRGQRGTASAPCADNAELTTYPYPYEVCFHPVEAQVVPYRTIDAWYQERACA
jgi:hypothetical protein